MMKKKNNFLFLIFCLICLFVFSDNVLADESYFILDYEKSLDFINTKSNVVVGDKNPRYYLDYLKTYIDENNSLDLDYSLIYVYDSSSSSGAKHNFYVVFHNDLSTKRFELSVSHYSGSNNSSITVNYYMPKKITFTEDTFSNETLLNNNLSEINDFLSSPFFGESGTQIRYVFIRNGVPPTSNTSISEPDFQFVPFFSTLEFPFVFGKNIHDDDYLKKLKVNDVIYDYGEKFSSIYNLSDFSNPDDSPNFTNKYFLSEYSGLFLSNIPKDSINDFLAEFVVGQVGEYVDFEYHPSFYGRVNHGTYYTYEPIECGYHLTSDEPYYERFAFIDNYIRYDKKYFEFTSCSSDLTNYDNIYVSLHNLYSEQIFNFSSRSNYGFIYANDFLKNYVKVLDFYDLDKNSAYMLSLKNPSYNTMGTYFGSLNNKVFDLVYNKDTFSFTHISPGIPIHSDIFHIKKIDSYYNTKNIMFDLSYSEFSNDTLLIVVDENSLVSYNHNYKEDFSFSYYDDTDSIITSDFDIYVQDSSSNNYNIDNYFDIVRNFIDSLSNDINQFSEVLQSCYDLAPEFIKSFIFALYVLLMSYILFKLIGK